MTECRNCGRAAGDAFACTSCADAARRHLADVAYLARFADSKRARVGSNWSTGYSSPAAERPLPYDARVSRVLEPAKVALHGTARIVLEECPEHIGDGSSPVADSLASVADWLIQFVDWLRTRDVAPEEFETFAYLSEQISELFDRPPVRLYVGSCGAPMQDEITCTEALYVETNERGEPASAVVSCPHCKTTHYVRERREELAEAVAGYQATAKEISVLCRLTEGDGVSVRMIQTYAAHGLLQPRGERLELDAMGRVRRTTTYRIGDVRGAIAAWKVRLEARRKSKSRAA